MLLTCSSQIAPLATNAIADNSISPNTDTSQVAYTVTYDNISAATADSLRYSDIYYNVIVSGSTIATITATDIVNGNANILINNSLNTISIVAQNLPPGYDFADFSFTINIANIPNNKIILPMRHFKSVSMPVIFDEYSRYADSVIYDLYDSNGVKRYSVTGENISTGYTINKTDLDTGEWKVVPRLKTGVRGVKAEGISFNIKDTAQVKLPPPYASETHSIPISLQIDDDVKNIPEIKQLGFEITDDKGNQINTFSFEDILHNKAEITSYDGDSGIWQISAIASTDPFNCFNPLTFEISDSTRIQLISFDISHFSTSVKVKTNVGDILAIFADDNRIQTTACYDEISEINLPYSHNINIKNLSNGKDVYLDSFKISDETVYLTNDISENSFYIYGSGNQLLLSGDNSQNQMEQIILNGTERLEQDRAYYYVYEYEGKDSNGEIPYESYIWFPNDAGIKLTLPIDTLQSGDINNDGFIDNIDKDLLNSRLAQEKAFTHFEIFQADLNSDGTIDASDLAVLEEKIANPSTTTTITTTSTTTTTATTSTTETQTTSTTTITTEEPPVTTTNNNDDYLLALYPNKDAYYGIDVSFWQGTIDWEQVAASGVDFAIIRAGYGNDPSQEDIQFRRNIEEAQKYGIACGVYWYSYALSPEEAALEADVCYSIIKDYKLEYPVMFDIEDPSQDHLDNQTMSDMVDSFCSRMESYGYYTCLYSYSSILKYRLDPELYEKYDVWVAHFDVDTPDFQYNYGIWQYTPSGTINGIYVPVDLNISYKNYPYIMHKYHFNNC